MKQKAIKADLPNGSSFIVDILPEFTKEESINLRKDYWKEHYDSINVKDAVLSVVDFEDSEILVKYNKIAYQFYGEPFYGLKLNRKVNVVEEANKSENEEPSIM